MNIKKNEGRCGRFVWRWLFLFSRLLHAIMIFVKPVSMSTLIWSTTNIKWNKFTRALLLYLSRQPLICCCCWISCLSFVPLFRLFNNAMCIHICHMLWISNRIEIGYSASKSLRIHQFGNEKSATTIYIYILRISSRFMDSMKSMLYELHYGLCKKKYIYKRNKNAKLL